jgi:hypothetical protein
MPDRQNPEDRRQKLQQQQRRLPPSAFWLRTCGFYCLLLAGCGYQQAGMVPAGADRPAERRSLYRTDLSTVAVPIFTNRTFHRGLEFELTKAVSNHLEATTPYKIVSANRSDTILEGHIVEVTIHTVSGDFRAAIPQEQLMTLRVDFVWKDLRSGRILAQRRNFEQTAAYYPTLGESRFTGHQQAVERLAAAIVQELQAEW